MIPSPNLIRSAALSSCAALLFTFTASAADPVRIVFQNGRSILASNVSLQGETISVKNPEEGFAAGQTFPLSSADHVYGDKPPELNPAISMLLNGSPRDALRLLEPILVAQKVTAKIPGNFWLEAARAALVAYALDGNSARAQEIGKEIADATPAQGIEPFAALGKALLMPGSAKVEERESALSDLTTEDSPTDLAAYACFYRGNLLKGAKRNADALEAYLMVPCLFPAGGSILNAAAELNASELLLGMSRREEAIELLKSAARDGAGTLLATEANKRLESTK